MQSPNERSLEMKVVIHERDKNRSSSKLSPQPPVAPKTSRLVRNLANPKLLDSLSASKKEEGYNVSTIASKIAKELEKDDSLVQAIKRKEKVWNK